MDNNRANQLNPNNSSFWKSRGYSDRPSGWLDIAITIVSAVASLSQAGLDNRSNQLNPNSNTYWSSRGQSKP
ncbi:hypothetical protein NQ318_017561 [Aromia moschata]|uniref:Uncharacterized protein n=1 Tax=Aromia moschata TaxID=1265417 RepID=A0AAV8Z3J9_9CUCU|nr:hypothetical protein NQ318_017561 [Aromia moschata]